MSQATIHRPADTAADAASGSRLGPNWRQVGAFLGLTFGLTWLLDLTIYLRGGRHVPGVGNTGQLSGLIPAFSAILLGLFFFPASPIYNRRTVGRGRWFYYFFLLYTALHAAGAVCTWLDPSE